VSTELCALAAGAAALLEAEGRPALASLVRAAHVALIGPAETWSMGAREVQAHRVALALAAEAFLELTSDGASLEAVRAAFSRAMRSPGTELSELHVELLLPAVERPWSLAYRAAPVRDLPAEPPAPESVLAGAAALLEALGDLAGAAMLGRARLETATVPGTGTPLTRAVLQLHPGDRALTWRDPTLEDRLRRAVHDAARRAAEQVIVELGVQRQG
jgi:hypothetical protein